MTKMAASMRPQMEAMRASGGAAAPSGGGGGGGGGSSGAAAAAGGLPDMANMDLDKGLDMLKNMNPDMMKAGINMMKNMDPAMMKSMSKMMGREVDEKQLEQMQKGDERHEARGPGEVGRPRAGSGGRRGEADEGVPVGTRQ